MTDIPADDRRDALRASYDRIAAQYADAFFDELSHKPFDCDLLDAFAQDVQRLDPNGVVWDVGCGPGHVAHYLYDRGVTSVHGLDLSAQMVAQAQRLSPHIAFQQGSMLAIPSVDATATGIASFYAIIHLTRDEAEAALREFQRVLRPGGPLLLAFHGGEGEIHNDEWFGKQVSVTATLFSGAEMAHYAQRAGFTDVVIQERPPYAFEHPTQRVYLSARAGE